MPFPKIKNPIAKQFFEDAEKILQANSQKARKEGKKDFEHPVIQQDQPEFEAWLRYFDHHLGWRPVAMQRVLDDSEKMMTVPTQWPQWFDTSFREAVE